jgi:hypothetical protein
MGRILHVESDCRNNSIKSGRHNIQLNDIQHNDTKRCNSHKKECSVAIFITFLVMLTAVMLSIDILSIVVLTAVLLSVVMLTAVMLSIDILSIVVLTAVILSVVMLTAVMLSVVALNSPLHTAARLPCNLICTLYHKSFYDRSKLEGWLCVGHFHAPPEGLTRKISS